MVIFFFWHFVQDMQVIKFVLTLLPLLVTNFRDEFLPCREPEFEDYRHLISVMDFVLDPFRNN